MSIRSKSIPILLFISLFVLAFLIIYHRVSQESNTPLPGPTLTITQTPTISGSTTPQQTGITHIFVIVMENRSYEDIIGNTNAPYINALARTYGYAKNYYGITHPSLPNYIAMTSGDTQGISSDCISCFVGARNIADLIEAKGLSWRAYMEDMPSNCYLGNSGEYAQRHNPFVYYNDIRQQTNRCMTHDVPLTQFNTDMSTNTLPNFVFISPNLCHDMHDCTTKTGDTWLSSFIPSITNSNVFANSILFLTWDEGETPSLFQGGHIPTIVISPFAKRGFTSTIQEDHYSLLRTIEDIWHLSSLGKSSSKTPMTEYFTKSF